MASIPQRKERKNSLIPKFLIVVLGPTASGKSALAVRLAKKFSGEIISADSRQVYKGLDIGTAKVSKKEMRSVLHHLIDITSLRTKVSVASWRNLARKKISSIHAKNNVAFLVGGSPLYIYSLVDQWTIPNIKPNPKLRKKLEKFSQEELFLKLKVLDPVRAGTIETKNKRRLVRALEIILMTKRPVPLLQKRRLPYPTLFLGLNPKNLASRIHTRQLSMVRKGLVQEVEKLKRNGLSWKRIDEFGFEYKYAAAHARKEISKKEMISKIEKATRDFVRRQMSWFKKDKCIRWIKNLKEAKLLVKKFLAHP